VVAKGPDAGCGVRGDGLGGVRELVPALAEAGVLDECHFFFFFVLRIEENSVCAGWGCLVVGGWCGGGDGRKGGRLLGRK
jgi:hypothetical protein